MTEKSKSAPVPDIDYEALIAAAYKRDRKWAQGTNGCVAFKCGAEWFREQCLAQRVGAGATLPEGETKKRYSRDRVYIKWEKHWLGRLLKIAGQIYMEVRCGIKDGALEDKRLFGGTPGMVPLVLLAQQLFPAEFVDLFGDTPVADAARLLYHRCQNGFYPNDLPAGERKGRSSEHYSVSAVLKPHVAEATKLFSVLWTNTKRKGK